MIKIATWNVNSVKARIDNIVKWCKDLQPDILLLQELKCIEEQFPREIFEDMGYNLAISGQKTFNGVAIASKLPLEDITTKLTDNDLPNQARFISAVVSLPNNKAINVTSVYVPNGGEVDSANFRYKLNFLDALNKWAREFTEHDEMYVIGGDFNVALQDIDVYDPINLEGSICYHPEEKLRMRALLNVGLYDLFRKLNPDKQQFSWWDYRAGSWHRNHGMRLDYILLSPSIFDYVKQCNIDDTTRAWERPSDHSPVWCEIEI